MVTSEMFATSDTSDWVTFSFVRREAGIHSGKSPVGLAAAAVYAAALLTNEKVTQSEVSEVANISEVTIRNRYKELLEAEDTGLTA